MIIRPGWPTASAGGGRRDGGPDGLLAALVDQLAIGVVAVDAQRRITLWNAEAERLTGFSTDEAVGALATELGVAPQDRAQAQQQAARLLAGESWVGEFPVRRKDGQIVTLRFRATGVTDPDGLPVAVVGAFDDATQAQRREEALAQLDALFEATTLGLAYFDTDLRYRRVNAAVTEMAGGTVADRVGRSMADVHGEPVGTAVVTALREVLATGQPRRNVRISGRLFHGRGAHQEWSVDFYPVRAADQRLLGVGAALRDVTTEQRTLDRYQSLVTATSAAVWTRDAEGRAVEDSPSFRAVTGQDFDDYIGWGYLDAVHPDDRAATRQAWQDAVRTGTTFTVTNRLRTADGQYRHFRVRAAPVLAGGRILEWIGTETDVEDEVRARLRLELLGRATAAMAAELEPEAELRALAACVVPDFADVCALHILDPPYRATPEATRRRVLFAGPDIPADLARSGVRRAGDDPISESIRTGKPMLVRYPLDPVSPWAADPVVRRWVDDVGLQSTLIAPVFSEGRVVAALAFAACRDRPHYTPEDLAFVTELAARASTAVEHGRAFQRTREAALTLQMAMLTDPPTLPPLEIEVRYQPAAAPELEVGGDWYDAFMLPGGELAIAVGDVAGHDLAAATAMGQLRSMLRALAFSAGTRSTPARVLKRLDYRATTLEITRFTSVLYGRLHHDQRTGQVHFRWSNAGHPPPMLVTDGAPSRLLGSTHGPVLGITPERRRREDAVTLPAAATLVLYTDGLVERPGISLDEGISALLALADASADLPLKDFCDHLLHDAPGTGDDIALLAVRLPRAG